MQGTPAVVTIDGKDILVTPAGLVVAATDGRVLANAKFRLSYNSPLVHDGVVYAHESGDVKALRLPKSLDSPFELDLLWKARGSRGDRMSSALYHNGLVFSVTRHGIVDAFDASTGDVVYRKRLPGQGAAYSSATLAGEFIFFGKASGDAIFVRVGREYKIVAENEVDPFRSTPIFKDQRMYLRTNDHLYCIQNK